jgi:hypothetical protein
MVFFGFSEGVWCSTTMFVRARFVGIAVVCSLPAVGSALRLGLDAVVCLVEIYGPHLVDRSKGRIEHRVWGYHPVSAVSLSPFSSHSLGPG